MEHEEEAQPPAVVLSPMRKGLSLVGWYSIFAIYLTFTLVTGANANNSLCYKRLVIVNNLVLFFGTYFLRNLQHRQLNATGGLELGLQLWIIKIMNTYDYNNNPSRCLYQVDTNTFVLASTYFYNVAFVICNFLLVVNVAFMAFVLYSSVRRMLNHDENPQSLANERNRGLTDEEIDQLPNVYFEASPARGMRRSPMTAGTAGDVLDGGLIARQECSEANMTPNRIGRPTLSEADERTTCAICITAYNQGDLIIRLPLCQHAFHKTCIINWLRLHSLCPYCRNNVRDALFNLEAPQRQIELATIPRVAPQNAPPAQNDQEGSQYHSFHEE